MISNDFDFLRRIEEVIYNDKPLKEIIELHQIWLSSNGKKGARANLTKADLSIVNLNGANLSGANLTGANLSQTFLIGTNLRLADLTDANLHGATLVNSDLSMAFLIRAKLTGANLVNAKLFSSALIYTDLTGAILDDANFEESRLGYTIFSRCDLLTVKNLDKAIHHASSIIDINSIPRLDNLPYVFLKGVGFNDDFIKYYPSIFIGSVFQFYSCFISYSNKNIDFAECLKSKMQAAGLRTWFAPEDFKIGEKIRDGIDKAIMIYDKMLLILSKDSINSQWVEGEVESALEKERKTGRIILFPVRIDDAIFNVDYGWAKLIKNSRHMGDFTHWENHEAFKKSFGVLLRSLKTDL